MAIYWLYARVSTQHQADSGLGLEAQTAALQRYADFREWPPDARRMVTDAGYSGSNMQRPGLVGLLEQAQHGDTILTHRYDRISRSTRDYLNLVHDMSLRGIAMANVDPDLDSGSPYGAAMVTVLMAMAELERDISRFRTKEAMQARKANGLPVGKPPFGYRWDDQGAHVVDPREVQILCLLWYHQYHHSLQALADMLERKALFSRAGTPYTRQGIRSLKAYLPALPDILQDYRDQYPERPEAVTAISRALQYHLDPIQPP